jgi:hypothetical protein
MDENMKDDYTWLQGFNYVPSYARNDIEFWRDYDPAVIEREMEYAKRLGLNCVRPFLAWVVYRNDGEKFIRNVTHFVRTAYRKGIHTIPVVWDSCFSEEEPLISADANRWFSNPGPMYLGEQYREEQYHYNQALIDSLKDEPGLLMWDIHNEPWMTAYYTNYKAEEQEKHFNEILDFIRNNAAYFHHHDSRPVTVGVAFPERIQYVAKFCDVLSFHDYSRTKKLIAEKYDEAAVLSKELGKPVFCSEMCCPARGNPYDIAIETAREKDVGFILWELMIGRCFWGDRHGIVYSDGTIRDPATVAALAGFYRKRNGGEWDYNLNTEGLVDRTLESARAWLGDSRALYGSGLELLNTMANMVESGALVPLNILPTARILGIEKAGEDREVVKALMLEWIPVLKTDADSKRDISYAVL